MQHVVFNARYADYANLGTLEFLRAVTGDINGLPQRGLDIQVVKMTLEWQAPAYFDDILEIRVQASHIGNSSFTLLQEIRRVSDDKPLCRVEIVYVLMSQNPFAKTPIPDDIRQMLENGAPGVLQNDAAS